MDGAGTLMAVPSAKCQVPTGVCGGEWKVAAQTPALLVFGRLVVVDDLTD